MFDARESSVTLVESSVPLVDDDLTTNVADDSTINGANDSCTNGTDTTPARPQPIQVLSNFEESTRTCEGNSDEMFSLLIKNIKVYLKMFQVSLSLEYLELRISPSFVWYLVRFMVAYFDQIYLTIRHVYCK